MVLAHEAGGVGYLDKARLWPMLDWQDLVCSYLPQKDLVNLAIIPGWSAAAIARLIKNPDLSECSHEKLAAFLQSVEVSKFRRRSCQTLDLVVEKQTSAVASIAIFDPTYVVDVAKDYHYRYEGRLFESLLSTFKHLRSLRVYGHSMSGSLRAHYASLGKTLVDLRIYNLGPGVTDDFVSVLATRLAGSLQYLHLEHPAPTVTEFNTKAWSPKTLKVSTVDYVVECLPHLRSFGIGCVLENIQKDRSFIHRLFHLEHVEFIRIPEFTFDELLWAPLACSWKSLKVRDCPEVRPDDLDIVLRRLPKLLTLDWKFPDDTYYEGEKHELKTAVCRRLKTLILQNTCLGDQCLMRVSRVLSSLETLALANCEEIHRIRSSCARHYIIKELSSFMPDLYEAFEECLQDMKTLSVIGQTFYKEKELATAIEWMFRDAPGLQYLVFRNCKIGQSPTAFEEFCKIMSRTVTVIHTDELRLIANMGTRHRGSRSDKHGINPMSFPKIGALDPRTMHAKQHLSSHTKDLPLYNSDLPRLNLGYRRDAEIDFTSSRLRNRVLGMAISSSDRRAVSLGVNNAVIGHPDDRSKTIKDPIKADVDADPASNLEAEGPSLSIQATATNVLWPSFSLEELERRDARLSSDQVAQTGWPMPRKCIAWGTPDHGVIERQKHTRFYNPNNEVSQSAAASRVPCFRAREDLKHSRGPPSNIRDNTNVTRVTNRYLWSQTQQSTRADLTCFERPNVGNGLAQEGNGLINASPEDDIDIFATPNPEL